MTLQIHKLVCGGQDLITKKRYKNMQIHKYATQKLCKYRIKIKNKVKY